MPGVGSAPDAAARSRGVEVATSGAAETTSVVTAALGALALLVAAVVGVAAWSPGLVAGFVAVAVAFVAGAFVVVAFAGAFVVAGFVAAGFVVAFVVGAFVAAAFFGGSVFAGTRGSAPMSGVVRRRARSPDARAAPSASAPRRAAISAFPLCRDSAGPPGWRCRRRRSRHPR